MGVGVLPQNCAEVLGAKAHGCSGHYAQIRCYQKALISSHVLPLLQGWVPRAQCSDSSQHRAPKAGRIPDLEPVMPLEQGSAGLMALARQLFLTNLLSHR